MTDPRPSIMAAGPLTLEEAETVLSSTPPPLDSEAAEEVERCSCEESLALRDEVERLRSELAQSERARLDHARRSLEAQAERDTSRTEVERLRAELTELNGELAGANALVTQCLRDLETDPHAEEYYAGLIDDLREHLAGKAATGEHPSEPSTDTLRQQVEYWRDEACTAHAAEQRVLEANKELDADWLRSCEFSRDMRIVNFARAELARREGK
jgi:hypothetical protein